MKNMPPRVLRQTKINCTLIAKGTAISHVFNGIIETQGDKPFKDTIVRFVVDEAISWLIWNKRSICDLYGHVSYPEKNSGLFFGMCIYLLGESTEVYVTWGGPEGSHVIEDYNKWVSNT
jgi:hypothetical protein